MNYLNALKKIDLKIISKLLIVLVSINLLKFSLLAVGGFFVFQDINPYMLYLDKMFDFEFTSLLFFIMLFFYFCLIKNCFFTLDRNKKSFWICIFILLFLFIFTLTLFMSNFDKFLFFIKKIFITENSSNIGFFSFILLSKKPKKNKTYNKREFHVKSVLFVTPDFLLIFDILNLSFLLLSLGMWFKSQKSPKSKTNENSFILKYYQVLNNINWKELRNYFFLSFIFLLLRGFFMFISYLLKESYSSHPYVDIFGICDCSYISIVYLMFFRFYYSMFKNSFIILNKNNKSYWVFMFVLTIGLIFNSIQLFLGVWWLFIELDVLILNFNSGEALFFSFFLFYKKQIEKKNRMTKRLLNSGRDPYNLFDWIFIFLDLRNDSVNLLESSECMPEKKGIWYVTKHRYSDGSKSHYYVSQDGKTRHVTFKPWKAREGLIIIDSTPRNSPSVLKTYNPQLNSNMFDLSGLEFDFSEKPGFGTRTWKAMTKFWLEIPENKHVKAFRFWGTMGAIGFGLGSAVFPNVYEEFRSRQATSLANFGNALLALPVHIICANLSFLTI